MEQFHPVYDNELMEWEREKEEMFDCKTENNAETRKESCDDHENRKWEKNKLQSSVCYCEKVRFDKNRSRVPKELANFLLQTFVLCFQRLYLVKGAVKSNFGDDDWMCRWDEKRE